LPGYIQTSVFPFVVAEFLLAVGAPHVVCKASAAVMPIEGSRLPVVADEVLLDAEVETGTVLFCGAGNAPPISAPGITAKVSFSF